MKAEKLLAKLECEADCDRERKQNEQWQQVIRSETQQSEQSRKKLLQLRARTAEIEEELDLRQQVEQEQERFYKAQRTLRQKDFTPEERKEHDAEIRRGQIAFSRVIAENHPDWREHSAKAFAEKKL